MKRLVITMLLCVVTCTKCLTIKEKALLDGFSENWSESSKDLVLENGLTINGTHVPKYDSLFPKTKVCFPVPARNFLQNKDDVFFETNGSFEFGIYCGPEEGSSRELWSIVETSSGERYTVPTARLLIHEEDLLKAAGYVKNWKERNNLSIPFIDLAENNSTDIQKEDVPVYGLLPRYTEVFFPAKNNSFEHGHYLRPDLKPNDDGSTKIFISSVIDDNKTIHSVPTASLMIHRKMLESIENACRINLYSLADK